MKLSVGTFSFVGLYLSLACVPGFATEDGLLRGTHSAHSSPKSHHHERMLLDGTGANGGHPLLLRAATPGSLGGLDLNQPNHMNAAFQGRLLADLGGSGREILVVKSTNHDQDGNVHVRFNQEIHGVLIEGASIVVHTTADGTITAINGELVPVEAMTEDMVAFMIGGQHTFEGGAQDLLEQARQEAGVDGGEWSEDKPVLAVVRRPLDGSACLAWKRLYSYQVQELSSHESTPHADLIFADATMAGSVSTGGARGGGVFPGPFGQSSNDEEEEKPFPVLCASHPMIMGDGGVPTMMTYDCQESYGNNCVLESDSSTPIYHADFDVMTAHNYAYKTYQYFWEGFGRDSMDDLGMPLISRVHFGMNYNNAFWDGYRMTYGDGDGVIFIPLNRGLDVVAHELTHGVTQHTSNLVYRGQSGALNEAMSDIFAALVEEKDGKSEFEIWHVGEEVFTPDIDGDALRSLSDPEAMGDFDYFPTRYRGNADNGGVHWNSGIANLAFHLLVKGGSHPQGKTDVEVPSIGYINAAYIFYHANVNCLTPDSTFYMARICTAEIFGGEYTQQIHLAWDAVGVPRDPPIVYWLTPSVALGGQSGAHWEVNRYMLGPIEQGARVRCTTAANNGDADLFVRFGLPADIFPGSLNNACYGYRYGSYEDCTTDAAPEPTMVHIGVHAWRTFNNLSIQCEIIAPPADPEGGESGSNEDN